MVIGLSPSLGQEKASCLWKGIVARRMGWKPFKHTVPHYLPIANTNTKEQNVVYVELFWKIFQFGFGCWPRPTYCQFFFFPMEVLFFERAVSSSKTLQKCPELASMKSVIYNAKAWSRNTNRNNLMVNLVMFF